MVENTSVSVIIVTINNVLNLLVIKYVAGIIKNNKLYQIGVSIKMLECIESTWTEADSIDVKNNPSANINVNMLLNPLGYVFSNISLISKLFVFLQTYIMKYK